MSRIFHPCLLWLLVAEKPPQRVTPVVVGPQSSVRLKGLFPSSRARQERKRRDRLAKYARQPTENPSQSESAGPSSQLAMDPTGPSSQPTSSTSQGTTNPSSEKLEAMDTGALASSSAADSEEASKESSEVEDTFPAGGGPPHLGPAEGETVTGRVMRLVQNANLRWSKPSKRGLSPPQDPQSL